MSPGNQALLDYQLGAAAADWAPLMNTTDVDEATAALRPAFFPLDITPSSKESFRVEVRAEQLPHLSIGYLGMGGEAVMRVPDVGGYHIAIAISGHTVSRWGDRHPSTVTAPGAATVFGPGTSTDLTWSHDCAQLGIKIDQNSMERELENLLDRSLGKPVDFARRLDLTTTRSVSWLSLVGVLSREAGKVDGLLRHRLAVANLQQLLIEGLLLTQPHGYSDELSGDDGTSAARSAVEHAIDLMRCYPETAWTTAQLARDAGVSPRALQKAFARAGELPPMSYLREVRLHRVRCELVDASERGAAASVTTVATRWGFVHLGRFAQQYRQLFGESPSQTLRPPDREA
ncbi:AraC family transcriptional regulator [Mycolicibacterium arabiense]|uniref:AraC family transcriptional regulator n=1 Tax=Mycolicibacterium arabiense TaxID=1286181 RepID=A0A7I7RU23_9MYCO|nr:AraC family transcriptional regulator [Mycolicibacterium arabiense]MCV7373469.1 AraC family transcriptional regulator [Mycolicibacterium arabiense]BBY48098.1 AraC family transcriptional regulator [Mycolicibacterium arabiense]